MPLLGLTAACSAPSLKVAVEPGTPVDRLAAVALDTRGRVLGATGLLPNVSAVQTQLLALSASKDEISSVLLVGYEDDDLARAAGGVLPYLETLAGTPLVAAGPELPLLPAPVWRREGPVGDPIVAGPTEREVELSVSWLPACPTLIPPGRTALIHACSGFFCGASPVQRDCSLTIDVEACQPGGPHQLAVSPRGALSGAGTNWTCGPAEPTRGASFATSCVAPTANRPCVLEGFLAPFTVPFEVSAPTIVVPNINPTARLSVATDARVGYVLDLAPLPATTEACPYPGPRVVVLTRSERERGQGQHKLVMVDADSLEVLGEAGWSGSTPQRMVPDPRGAGVLVIGDSPLEVARVGCDLQVEQRVPLTGLGPVEFVIDADLAPRANGATELWVGIVQDLTTETGPGILTRVDPADLSSQQPLKLDPYRVGGVEVRLNFAKALDGALDRLLVQLVTVAEERYLVGNFDLTASPPVLQLSEAQFGAKLPVRHEVLAEVHASTQLMAVAISGAGDVRPSVIRVGEPSAMLTLEILEYTGPDRDMSSVLSWASFPRGPREPAPALVVSSERFRDPPVAYLGVADLEAGRLEPGRFPIGYGPAGRMRPDERGNVWIPLPWHGAIVRVRPSAPQTVPP